MYEITLIVIMVQLHPRNYAHIPIQSPMHPGQLRRRLIMEWLHDKVVLQQVRAAKEPDIVPMLTMHTVHVHLLMLQ